MSKRRMLCDDCGEQFTCSNHCKQNLVNCLCYWCDIKRKVESDWLKKCNKAPKPKPEKVVFT